MNITSVCIYSILFDSFIQFSQQNPTPIVPTNELNLQLMPHLQINHTLLEQIQQNDTESIDKAKNYIKKLFEFDKMMPQTVKSKLKERFIFLRDSLSMNPSDIAILFEKCFHIRPTFKKLNFLCEAKGELNSFFEKNRSLLFKNKQIVVTDWLNQHEGKSEFELAQAIHSDCKHLLKSNGRVNENLNEAYDTILAHKHSVGTMSLQTIEKKLRKCIALILLQYRLYGNYYNTPGGKRKRIAEENNAVEVNASKAKKLNQGTVLLENEQEETDEAKIGSSSSSNNTPPPYLVLDPEEVDCDISNPLICAFIFNVSDDLVNSLPILYTFESVGEAPVVLDYYIKCVDKNNCYYIKLRAPNCSEPKQIIVSSSNSISLTHKFAYIKNSTVEQTQSVTQQNSIDDIMSHFRDSEQTQQNSVDDFLDILSNFPDCDSTEVAEMIFEASSEISSEVPTYFTCFSLEQFENYVLVHPTKKNPLHTAALLDDYVYIQSLDENIVAKYKEEKDENGESALDIAIKNGNHNSKVELEKCLLENNSIRSVSSPSSEVEDQNALFDEAVKYYESNQPQLISKANDLFKKLANMGHVTAMYNLAVSYELGNELEQNYAEAHNWFTKAAEGGQVNAMVKTAQNLEIGQGCTKNLSKAKKWFAKASELGNDFASSQLSRF